MKHCMKLTFIIDFILIGILFFSYYLERHVGLLLYTLNRIALKIEVPKLERRIASMSKEELEDSGVLVFEPYIISVWEPGFLDDQLVLVYDSTDELGKGMTEKHFIPVGKLYPVIRAGTCFYLCDLER